MTEIIFLIQLESHSDIERIMYLEKKYDNKKIISLDYRTHKILDKHKISHEISDSYLTQTERKTVDDYSVKITSEWYDEEKIKKFLTYRDVNLGSLIEMEVWQYLTPIFKSALEIQKIIEKETPQKIFTYSTMNDYISKICKKHTLDLIILEQCIEPSLHYDIINVKYNIGKIPISFNLSRKNFLYIKNITEKIILTIFNLEAKQINKKKSILLLDFNPMLYDVLLREISKIDKQVLLLNQRRPAIWNLTSFNIVRNSNCKILRLEKDWIKGSDGGRKDGRNFDDVKTTTVVFPESVVGSLLYSKHVLILLAVQ